ncbi:hypothetical protein NEF87_000404 [Candidatus Lokiarchaeum ossiferum]|uniref:Uncharacterized protein n=1 Tax=Candidatus Lokiarchaeum ossiferum TaxID=2951803 RepID=A0ABY6HNH4_9ARCH|nr:hypothetical protein NEF87_000404 [Candidatus Lokiarchaeum sp. B-35]
MSMYRKYLLKKNFWAQPKKDGSDPSCYVKHDIRTGGIYAYVQHRGVKIVADNKSKEFSNFNELDQYLDQLSMSTREDTTQFMQVLNRRNSSKMLRKITI